MTRTTGARLTPPIRLSGMPWMPPSIRFRKPAPTRAILCFSRNWDNLLLWSHYGDSHTGVCLGFDIAEGDPGANYDTDVLYQPNVIPAPRGLRISPTSQTD